MPMGKKTTEANPSDWTNPSKGVGTGNSKIAGELKLTRAYLNAGVMINGVVTESHQGCQQGGPLSPLLSNVMLNQLDHELERREHLYCRYADDRQIYVKSEN